MKDPTTNGKGDIKSSPCTWPHCPLL